MQSIYERGCICPEAPCPYHPTPNRPFSQSNELYVDVRKEKPFHCGIHKDTFEPCYHWEQERNYLMEVNDEECEDCFGK